MKIDVKDFNLYYGDFHALKNINIGMPEHEVSALIGPSGCGKSTLLKSLNRMNDLVPGVKITGRAALDGVDIYGNIDVNDLRRRVGMVFQKPNPFPMSVYDNVAYGPRTHGIRARGELDAIVEKSLRQAAIEDLINELKGQYTIVIVTHNMQQAARISDQTAFFLHGEMVECAPTLDIFAHPADKRTEDYITGRFG